MYHDTPNSMITFLSFSSKYAQVKLNLEIRLRTEKVGSISQIHKTKEYVLYCKVTFQRTSQLWCLRKILNSSKGVVLSTIN